MKIYPVVDLTGDKYLNPDGLVWNDNEGSHARAVGEITSISVHHDAVERPHDYDSVGRYHNEATEHYLRLGYGLQYHYKIDNTGVIFRIRPLTTWLNVVGSAANRTTLAICLDGNFQDQKPTQEQFEALWQLLTDLTSHHPEFPAAESSVWPHQHFSSTACCGANLVPWVNQYRESNGGLNIPQVGYDWPTMQPSAPTPPPPPTPAPPAPHPAPAPPSRGSLDAVVSIVVPALNARTAPNMSGQVVARFVKGTAHTTGWILGESVRVGNRTDNVWLISDAGHYFAQAGTNANYGHAPARLTAQQSLHLAASETYGVLKRADGGIKQLIRRKK